MGYSHRVWACPYYRSDKADRVYCFGGTIKFPDGKSLIRYANQYCGSARGWARCSVAAAWTDYVNKEDNREQKTAEEKQTQKS